MLNKKMMKKNGTKTISAILIAASMMSAAVPAMAAENNNEFTQIVTEAPADLMQNEMDPGGEEAPDPGDAIPNDNADEEEKDPEESADPGEKDSEETEDLEEKEPEETENPGEKDPEETENPGEKDPEETENPGEKDPEETEDPEEKDPEEKDPEEKDPEKTPDQGSEKGQADEEDILLDGDEGKATKLHADGDGDWVDVNAGWAKHIKEQEAKDKKEREEAAKKRKATVDKAGEQVGDFVLKLINGKYNNATDAIGDFSIKTIKFMNENFVKDLPYVGTFANALIKGAMGENTESTTDKRLTQIYEQLKIIEDTINKCTDRVTNQNKSMKQDGKIQVINNTYDKLTQGYRDYSQYFEQAMLIISSADEKDSKGRETNLARANAEFDKIYNADNTAFLNTYIAYCNEVMSYGRHLGRSLENDPDIFSAFKNVVKYDKAGNDKTGKFAEMEFIDARRNLYDSVNATCTYGYDMLSTIIGTQLANKEALYKVYDDALNELEKAMVGAPQDKKELLYDTYTDLLFQRSKCKTQADKLKIDLKLLDDTKSAYISYLNFENGLIQDDQDAYNKYVNNLQTSVEIDHTEYKTEWVNERVGYPTLNTKTNKIEYRDQYGNLLGTRDVDKEFKEVEPDQIKEDQIYLVKQGFMARCIPDGKPTEHWIRVLSVYEEDHWLLGKVKVVCGIDRKTGKMIALSIGAKGDYHVYQRTVHDIKNV